MTPESLTRDRKELFKERKNERASSDGGGSSGGGSNRWRDTRRPGGYGKGYPMLSEESFHGSGPSRTNDKILDDGSSRPFDKYGRNNREIRGGPFSQRGRKGHSPDAPAAATSSLNSPVRTQSDVNDKRSVDDILSCKSHPHPEFGNSCNQIDSKDAHDKNGGVSGLCIGQKLEGENSLSLIDWKTLKWTRSGSMSSRGSGLSNSSSSKSMGVESVEMKVDLHPQNVSPLQSPSCDAAACVTSPGAGGAASFAAPIEETSSRKKPRLGWGEGLAKFEKKKVDSPCDTAVKNGVILSESNSEPARCNAPNVQDRSPNLAGLLSCTSPATPSSVACSSSLGVEDKSLGRAADVETIRLCGSPSGSQNRYDDLSCNLVTLEETPIANLFSSLSELLQCNDLGSMDSDYMKSTGMNKLLVLKADISKKIEATESEIDSLENELKLLISDNDSVHPHPASSSSLPVVCSSKPSLVVGTASNLIPRLDGLQTSGDVMNDNTCGALDGELTKVKDEDIDSPGTATSKFSESFDLEKPVSQTDVLNHVESSWNVHGSRDSRAVKSPVYSVSEKRPDTRAIETNDSNCDVLSDNVGLQTENIYDHLIACNKEAACRASEAFSKLVPMNLSCLQIPMVNYSSCLNVNPQVKEKFAMRKRFMKFKERVLTLKYRVFQHLWKEDMRLLSIKRSRAKPQKKFELGTRMLPSGYQKHRASIRSRFSSPAGNLSLVPTTQVINFASKLLAESNTKIYRIALSMPSLVLDNKEKTMSRFISSNGLIDDPCSAEKDRCIINPWTSEEKEIFLDKYSVFGKDFRRIASFLDHKTTADCVEFYYKNHKSDSFQKTKKKTELAEKGKSYSKNTYLVTSGKKWNRDSNSASLDLLGAASAIAANDDDGLKNQKFAPRLIFGSNSRAARGDDVMSKRSSANATNNLGSDRENVAADVLVGICGSLSSEAMSSCITSSIDIGQVYQERKYQPVRLKKRRSLTPEIAQDIDEGTCSDESCGEVDSTDWNDDEKSTFVQAVSSYGKDFEMISQCVRTKSSDQCKVFFSKARKCLGLDMMQPGTCSGGASLSDNANGGGADTEDAFPVKTGAGVKSGSKSDEELSLSSSKPSQNKTYTSGTVNILADSDKLKNMNSTGESDAVVDELKREDVVSAESENKDTCLVSDNNRFENSFGKESLFVKVLENGFGPHTKTICSEAAESSSLKKPAIGPEVSDIVKPSSTTAESGVHVDSPQAELAGFNLSLPGNSLNDKALGIMPVSAGNVSLASGAESSGNLPGREHKNPMEVDAAPFFVSQNSVDQDPVIVQTEKSLNSTSISVSGKTGNAQLKISVSPDDNHHRQLKNSSMDQFNPSKSFQAYPPSILTNKGLNGDIGSYKLASSQGISEVNRNLFPDQLLCQDSCLQKCNGPKHNDTRSEHQLLDGDQLKENARAPRSRCLSDTDKPTRKGDVKLFGQILSHPSTQQKPNSRSEDKEDRDSKHTKLCENSFNLKITPSQNLDGIIASAKFDQNSYLGTRNLPVKSFGFWDGNRIQTGFPSLPDSAILLAKYPAAFGHYPPSSSSKVEQQQLHRINDCNMNGVSVMPTRELGGSKGVADYQTYRNCDDATLQSFAVDLKQQQNRYFSKMQRQRRGGEFDSVSSVPQQARGVVGLDVLGRDGVILGSGPRNTVSDPVAAIRRHYAGEQYNGQIGNIGRKEEAWRSNGNVGR